MTGAQFTITGDIDDRALAQELDAVIGDRGPNSERWTYTYATAGPQKSLTLYLRDKAISSAAAQAALERHVSKGAVIDRARARLIAEITPVECRKCQGHKWYLGSDHDKNRALQFSIFAVVLAFIGVGGQLAGIAGAWVFHALALFVLFQAMMKWVFYAHRSCAGCGFTTTDWLGRPGLPPDWEKWLEKLRSAENLRSGGEIVAARELLNEVSSHGYPTQRRVAAALLQSMERPGD